MLRVTKMGLNVKNFQLHLLRVMQIPIEYSYTVIQKHPLLASALVVLFCLYIFLSYIYSFMVYLSPFLLCIAIFVSIFWSSEQSQLKYAKIEEKKGEQKRNERKYPKILKHEFCEPVAERKRYLSQHAMSRRRNFKVNKWDMSDAVEEKEKDSSTECSNDITNIILGISMENNEVNSFEKGQCSSTDGFSVENIKNVDNSTLCSEPSMVQSCNNLDEQISKFDRVGGSELENENLEDQDDEDEEEAQGDGDQTVEWTEDDEKNLMDLGFSEIERNKRLESLIARRRARNLLKLQIEKGLIDIKNVTPSQVAPLFITRTNTFNSLKEFEDLDGLEMPGSAPSLLPPSRNPFDLPYDPSEEKPNLTGDSFHEEFTLDLQRDMPFCRHESFKNDHGERDSYPFPCNKRKAIDRLAYPRFRRFSDMANQDWLIEKLFNKEGDKGKITAKAPNPIGIREKSETDKIDLKADRVGNVSLRLNYRSDSELMKNSDYVFYEDNEQISNVEKGMASKKLVPRIRNPHRKFPKFPLSKRATIDDSLLESIPSPIDKNNENLFFTERRLCHTRSFSIASDLQVEVSEVGSPTLTNDGTNTTTDGESILYDGDNEKDFTSGSEDMWGASLHSRRAHRNNEDDMIEEGLAEVDKSLKENDSPIPNLQHIEEENSADVSSMSSGSDIADETPTTATNFNQKVFCKLMGAMFEANPNQPYDFSNATTSQKELMNSYMDTHPHKSNLSKSEKFCSNLPNNLINETEEVNDVNGSTSTDENIRGNEDPSALTLRKDLVDVVSSNSTSSTSPRSILLGKTIIDEVPPFVLDQQLHLEDIEANVKNMTQTTSNDELPLDPLPNDIQLMDHHTIQSHNGVISNSQELVDHIANSIEEGNFGHTSDTITNDKEDKEKIKSEQNNDEKPTTLFGNDVELESPGLVKTITSDDNEEKSREIIAHKATIESFKRIEEIDTLISVDRSKSPTKDEVALDKPNHIKDVDVDADVEPKKNIQGDTSKYEVINLEILPEVPFNSQTSESSSKAYEKKDDKTQSSSSGESARAKYDEMDKNESINPLLTPKEVEAHTEVEYIEGLGELAKLKDVKTPEQDMPHDSLEKGTSSYESNKFVKDLIGEENPATSDISKDSQQPILIDMVDLSSLKANKGKADKVINNKHREQELDKSNRRYPEENVKILYLQNIKEPKLADPNDSSKEVGVLRSDSNQSIEKELEKD